jgi:hypothetical protein
LHDESRAITEKVASGFYDSSKSGVNANNIKSDSSVESEEETNVRPRTWVEFRFGSEVEVKPNTDGQSCCDKGVSTDASQVEKPSFTRDDLDLSSNFKSDSDAEPESD